MQCCWMFWGAVTVKKMQYIVKKKNPLSVENLTIIKCKVFYFTLLSFVIFILNSNLTVGDQNYEPRLKRKLANDVAGQHNFDTDLLLHASSNSAIINKEKVSRNTKSNNRDSRKHNLKPSLLSNIEALSFLLENNLSKQQYINIKQMNNAHGCDIYPGYDEVRNTKLQCRPLGITIEENIAYVPLQNLLNHTTKRIWEMQKHDEINNSSIHSTLLFSYGFDGSTGQSFYKQHIDTLYSKTVN